MNRSRHILAALVLLATACGGNALNDGNAGTDGGTGGTVLTPAPGSGGPSGSGGATAATGGAANTGGVVATGGGCGALGTGGTAATGGSSTGGTQFIAPDGSVDAPNESSTAVCPPEPSPACSPIEHIASASEFVAVAAKLPWQMVSVSAASRLSLSGDLVADADLVIDASALVSPANCTTVDAGSSSPCHTPHLREYAFPNWIGTGLVAGVTCEGHVADAGFGPFTCSRMSIAKGTVFRIRAVAEVINALGDNSYIEFARPCSEPCQAGETRCAASQTCFAVGYDACRYCEGKEPALCACRDRCGSKADGSACSFDMSPDWAVNGKCSAGTCATTPGS